MTISELEVSPTNRAKCVKCDKAIPKGELRGKVFNDRFNSYNYLCKDCAYKQVITDIDNLNKMKQDLECRGVNLE
jgi:hypothetical protein